MTPANIDLSIDRGVRFGPVTLTCLDGSNVAVDLTGYTAYAQVRDRPTGGLVFDLEPEISDPGAGIITISKTQAQTDAMSDGINYGWDLMLEDAAGVRTGPYFAGKVAVRTRYTHLT